MLLPFELDPEIIHHIIYSQAGSIGKAVIELLMNSVDAEASAVRLTMTKEGFHCTDDGRGFASREDVLRYFGRFGTPHQEGDATYGRFRLGRGQIMAHAKTRWTSNDWQMSVDTRSMGYNYELHDLEHGVSGCSIEGTWYESLNDLELRSAVQEIRDLVRYTPISVELNGRVITRDPATEKWDFEDEWAYYRAKEEGAVSIYNQGVLVRHDSSHLWGAGGLIVSKQAISLNVSRTEILRKTCPVWIGIAKRFGKLADEVSNRQGAHRKTEARREKSARSLLSGDAEISTIFWQEEVITVLPGKRHVTLEAFLKKAHCDHKNTFSVASGGRDIPKGEAIAQQGIIQIVHPVTLGRFGCHSNADFEEVLERVIANVASDAETKSNSRRSMPWYWSRHGVKPPQLVAFSTLKEAFLERTRIVDEKEALDKETRRAWIALRCCLQHYAGACIGTPRNKDGTIIYGQHRFHVLLGESNTSEAWTDGKSYLAVNCAVIRRLKAEPLKTAAYIFSLIDHEIAHEGDSLECGHDEAFYQRYHDISIRMAPERQRFMHKWLMKYTMSMESEGKKANGNAWRERNLVDRVGSGRMKRGLSPAIEDLTAHPVVTTQVPEQSLALLTMINNGLIEKGLCPQPPDWAQVLKQARLDQQVLSERSREQKMLDEAYDEDKSRDIDRWFKDAQPRIAEILGVAVADIPHSVLQYLCDGWVCHGFDEQDIRNEWACQCAEPDFDDDPYDYFTEEELAEEQARIDRFNQEQLAADDPRRQLDKEYHSMVEPGETWWMLERNAAAAGFLQVEKYLKWRNAE
ncbi:ATP-binding protein [Pseudomonas fragariae (ex Marin et al. 2024)]|uniref:ATP-binding protein n=1 Tax=Pseudomonas fragariae (ex Marin et al. 2024) TaxID=3080056 RepID=UPI002A244718|nr:ATP-binding protein [Pseudomonas sp. 20]MDX9626238.1 ATP-binding protein [Pseudomonas sp. 20]